MSTGMTIHLRIWRQKGPRAAGHFVDYTLPGVLAEMSFLEMLDQLNEDLARKGEEPVAFESDCREGICGNCGLVVDGVPHGNKAACTTCELRMRQFTDGQIVTVEPFRASAFPVIKDLVVDRSSFDRIIQKGGYVSVKTGAAPEANLIKVDRDVAEQAMDAAACIGCGACVAACPNASASLFTGAKITQLALLPQGDLERKTRARAMVEQMDAEGFGDCSNHGECEAACPKAISILHIAKMRREFMRAMFVC